MSRLVVDQLQGRTSSSNTITIPAGHKINAVDAGAISAPGSVIQVVEFHSATTYTISSSSATKLFNLSITTKNANSKILVQLNVGRSAYNQDVDIALGMGYKTGATSATSSDYTSLHGSAYTRQLVDNLGSFWAQDTSDPGGGSWSGGYGIYHVAFNKLHEPNVSAGITLDYSLWGSSDGTFRIGNSYNTGTNGYDSSLILMEIAQ